MGFSTKYRFITFLSITLMEFVMLHSNLLLCWHGFRDVNITVNVGICWRRQSCFCGCLVNLTTCNTTYDWPTNHSPPNIIHDQLLIWTTQKQLNWYVLFSVIHHSDGQVKTRNQSNGWGKLPLIGLFPAILGKGPWLKLGKNDRANIKFGRN